MKTTKKTSWGDITIDTKRGTVTVLQRWKYVAWELGSRAPKFNPKPWTEAEKANFHKIAVSQIRAAWTPNVRFKPTGKNPFLRKFSNTGLKFNIDIRRVHANPHWKVTVRKDHEKNRVSEVIWARKQVLLSAHTETTISLRKKQTDQFGYQLEPVFTKFQSVPHEFGHMIGYIHDEYNFSSASYPDAHSVMNVGHQLRNRHFRHLDKVLDDMVFLTDFDVKVDKPKP